MKEQKIFFAVDKIDDDLISEAAEYRPSLNETGDVSEGVRYSVPEGGRTRRLWKYPVTAAAVLAVVGGALFVIGYNGGIEDMLGAATGEETGVTAVESDNGEVSTVGVTDMVSEETEPAVSEAVEAVVPLKEINSRGDDGEHKFDFPTALYVDSYPEIPQPELDEQYFTPMSTAELLDLYGLCNNIMELINENVMIEVVDENTHHGIYNFPDGSVYDINTFTFDLIKPSVHSANRFHLTLGKKTKFGQEFCEYYKQIGPKYGIAACGESSFYNEDMDILFTVFDYNYMGGTTVMFSASPDEITKNNFAGYPDEKDEYEFYNDKLIPYYFDMFINIRIHCMNGGNIYFDLEHRLWYNIENGKYFDEETGEWVPAEKILPVTQVKPTKAIDVHSYDTDKQEGDDETLFQVLCVPSLPTVPENNLGEECFEEMSTEELFKYYGLEYILEDLKKYHYEEADENTKHGIFTSPDGAVYDINTFVFHINESYVSDGLLDEWERLTVTVGKNTSFGREYAYEHKSFDFDKVCYNEESDTYFMVYDNVDGSCTVMLSVTVDELGAGFDNYEEYLKGFAELNGGVSPYAHSICQYAFRWFADHDGLRNDE